MQPTVSVIIACRNYAHFLPQAVRSLLAQDYEPWECLIIDDASTDDTRQVASSLVASDPRFRYYHNETNEGVSRSRNRAIRLAKGDLIAVLDADDWWEPSKLRLQARQFEKHPATQLSFCPFYRADGAGQSLKCVTDDQWHSFDTLLRAYNVILHSSVMVRKSLMDELGGYDTSLQTCEDWDLYLKILRRFGREGFGYVAQPLAYYRVHGKSISARWRQMKADERRVMRRHVLWGGWALKHPIGAWQAIDAQLEREIWESESAGDLKRAMRCAIGHAAIAPVRRWRWQQAGRLLRGAYLGTPGAVNA